MILVPSWLLGRLTGIVSLVCLPGNVHALCPTGFIPPDCLLDCKPGTYGANCASTCPGTCFYNMCHPKSGDCFKCRTGFRGPKCKEKCQPGFYGENCGVRCPPNCESARCDPYTGFCYKCLDGFGGRKCNVTVHLNSNVEGASKAVRRGKAKKSSDVETRSGDYLGKILILFVSICLPACAFCLGMFVLRKKIRRRRTSRQKRKKSYSSAIYRNWGAGEKHGRRSPEKPSSVRSSHHRSKVYKKLNDKMRKPDIRLKVFRRLTSRQSQKPLKDETFSNKGKMSFTTKTNSIVKESSSIEAFVQMGAQSTTDSSNLGAFNNSDLSTTLGENPQLRLTNAAKFFDGQNRDTSISGQTYHEGQNRGSRTCTSDQSSSSKTLEAYSSIKLSDKKLHNYFGNKLSNRFYPQSYFDDSINALHQGDSKSEKNKRVTNHFQERNVNFEPVRTKSDVWSMTSDSLQKNRWKELLGCRKVVERRYQRDYLCAKPIRCTCASHWPETPSKSEAKGPIDPRKSSATTSVQYNVGESMSPKDSHLNVEQRLEGDEVLKASRSWKFLQQSLLKVLEGKEIVRSNLPETSKAFSKPVIDSSVTIPANRQPVVKEPATGLGVDDLGSCNSLNGPTKPTAGAFWGRPFIAEAPQHKKSLTKVLIDTLRNLTGRRHQQLHLPHETYDVEMCLCPQTHDARLVRPNMISNWGDTVSIKSGISGKDTEEMPVSKALNVDCIVQIEDNTRTECRTAKGDGDFRTPIVENNEEVPVTNSKNVMNFIPETHQLIAVDDSTYMQESKISPLAGGTSLTDEKLIQNLPSHLVGRSNKTLSVTEYAHSVGEPNLTQFSCNIATRSLGDWSGDSSIFIARSSFDRSVKFNGPMDLLFKTSCITTRRTPSPPNSLADPSSSDRQERFESDSIYETLCSILGNGTGNHYNWFPFANQGQIPIYNSPLSSTKQSPWYNYSFLPMPAAQRVRYHPILFRLPSPPLVLPENDLFLEISYAKLTKEKPVIMFSDSPHKTKHASINTFEIVDKDKVRRLKSPAIKFKGHTKSLTSLPGDSYATHVVSTESDDSLREKPRPKRGDTKKSSDFKESPKRGDTKKSSDFKESRTSSPTRIKKHQMSSPKRPNETKNQHWQERCPIFLNVKRSKLSPLMTSREVEDNLLGMEEVEGTGDSENVTTLKDTKHMEKNNKKDTALPGKQKEKRKSEIRILKENARASSAQQLPTAPDGRKENSRQWHLHELYESKDIVDVIASDSHETLRRSKSLSDISKCSDISVHPRLSNEKSDKVNVKPPVFRSRMKSLHLEANSDSPGSRKEKEDHRNNLRQENVKTENVKMKIPELETGNATKRAIMKTEKNINVPTTETDKMKQSPIKFDTNIGIANVKTEKVIKKNNVMFEAEEISRMKNEDLVKPEKALRMSSQQTENVTTMSDMKNECVAKSRIKKPVPSPRTVFLNKPEAVQIREDKKSTNLWLSPIHEKKKVLLTPSPHNYNAFAATLDKVLVNNTECIVYVRKGNTVIPRRHIFGEMTERKEDSLEQGLDRKPKSPLSFSRTDSENTEKSLRRLFDSPSEKYEQEEKYLALQFEGKCDRQQKCEQYEVSVPERKCVTMKEAGNEVADCKGFQYILRSPESSKISTESPLILSGSLDVTLRAMEGDPLKVKYPLPSLLENVILQETQQCILPKSELSVENIEIANKDDGVQSISNGKEKVTRESNISARPRLRVRNAYGLTVQSAQKSRDKTQRECREESHIKKHTLTVALSPELIPTSTFELVDNENYEFKSLIDDGHDVYYDALDYSDRRNPNKHTCTREVEETLHKEVGKIKGRHPSFKNPPRRERNRGDGRKPVKEHQLTVATYKATKNVCKETETQSTKEKKNKKSEDQLDSLIAFRFASTTHSKREISSEKPKPSKRWKLHPSRIQKVLYRDISSVSERSHSSSEGTSDRKKVSPNLGTHVGHEHFHSKAQLPQYPLKRTKHSYSNKGQEQAMLGNINGQPMPASRIDNTCSSSSFSTTTPTSGNKPVCKKTEKVPPIRFEIEAKHKCRQSSTTDFDNKFTSSTQEDAFSLTDSQTQSSNGLNSHRCSKKYFSNLDEQKCMTPDTRDKADGHEIAHEVFYDVREVKEEQL